MLRTSTLTLASLLMTFAATLTLSGCDVEQTEEGEMPEVRVEEGEMPEYDVDAAEVEVGTTEEEVTVPDVEVETEEKTLEVPTIGIDPADASEPEAQE